LFCAIEACLIKKFVECRFVLSKSALQCPIAHANQVGTIGHGQPFIKVAGQQQTQRRRKIGLGQGVPLNLYTLISSLCDKTNISG
jgi:hypothetical protein